ncbi:MAG: hypothetical protein ACXAD7_02325 [Candidatus Kariarchaeaceae archaeon]|jgi:hypothetical protein
MDLPADYKKYKGIEFSIKDGAFYLTYHDCINDIYNFIVIPGGHTQCMSLMHYEKRMDEILGLTDEDSDFSNLFNNHQEMLDLYLEKWKNGIFADHFKLCQGYCKINYNAENKIPYYRSFRFEKNNQSMKIILEMIGMGSYHMIEQQLTIVESNELGDIIDSLSELITSYYTQIGNLTCIFSDFEVMNSEDIEIDFMCLGGDIYEEYAK